MAMSRSDWIATAAVIVAALVGIPQILSFFRIQPPAKDNIRVSLVSLKYELGHDNAQPDKQFFVAAHVKLRVLNESDKPIDISISPYSTTYESNQNLADYADSKSVDGNKPAEFEFVIINKNSYVINQAYNRIFDANNGDVEKALSKNGLSITNNLYVVYGQKNIVVCRDDTRSLSEEVTKHRITASYLTVHYGDNLQKICALGPGISTANDYW